MSTLGHPRMSRGYARADARPGSTASLWAGWLKPIGLLVVVIALLAALVAGAVVLLEPGPVEVRVASPAFQDIDLDVATTGKVIPIDEFQARASFPGIVEKVLVQLGDTVRPGQMLVQMRDPFAQSRVISAQVGLESTVVASENLHRGGSQEDLINLEGDWKRAMQEQASAQNALAVIKQLEETGAASPAEVYGADQRLQAANTAMDTVRARRTKRYSASDVASWDARVAQARASLKAEKTTFANINITSPIAGTVFLRPVQANDFVGAGAPLIDIADLNHVRVRAFFDEPDIGKLHVGQTVNIRWEGRPGQVWAGRVEHAPLAASAMGSRTVGECTISVDNARGELLPNTNVNVSVPVQQKKKVLTIPREALHTDGKLDFVFRVDGKKLIRTPVEVSLVNLDRVEITRGVTPNDMLALHSGDNSDLKDGLKVRIAR